MTRSGDEPPKFTATRYRWRDPASIPPMAWLYGYELQRGLVSLLVATSGVGKSTFEIGNALALATGKPLMGRKVWGGPCRVWYWNLEDDRDHLDRQIAAACQHWGITERDIGGRLFLDSVDEAAPFKIVTNTASGAIVQRPVSDALIAELQAREIDVHMVDPVIASHSIPENDNGAMELVVKEWGRISREANCATRLTSHTRKLGGFAADIEAARGGGALVAGARSGVVLNKMTKEEAKGWGVSEQDRRRFFSACDDKPNRAPPPDKIEWFELRSIDLGNGTTDRPADRIGVAAPWTPADPFDGVKVDHLRQVQARIADGEWRKDPQSKEWAGLAVAEVLALDLALKDHRQRASRLLATWIEKGALEIVERPDAKSRMKPFVVVGRPVATD